MLFTVIQKITPTKFEVKELEAANYQEIEDRAKQSKDVYLNVPGGWNQQDYPAGKFIIRWYTNFGYGDEHFFAYALVSYVNERKGTRTYINCHDDVRSLGAVAELMNHYANLTSEDAWELFEVAIHRLGMYREKFKSSRDYGGLESGYYREQEKLSLHDYDKNCVITQIDNIEIAASACIGIRELYNMKSHLSNIEDNDQVLSDMAILIDRLNKQFNDKLGSLISAGRSGNDIFVGTTFKYQLKY